MFKATYIGLLLKSIIQLFFKKIFTLTIPEAKICTRTKNFTYISFRIEIHWLVDSNINVNVILSQFQSILKTYLQHNMLNFLTQII